MKTKFISFLFGAASLGLATALCAQSTDYVADSAPRGGGAGLIGQNYAGANYTYTHHVSNLPSSLNTYGVIVNEAARSGFDSALKYDWTTGSALGANLQQHALALAFTGYVPLTWGKPFIEGDAGWVWQKTAGVRDNAFAYAVAGGVELQLLERLVLTPAISYEAAPGLDSNFIWNNADHDWYGGAKATYRISRTWSSSLGARMDTRHNIGYTLGVNYHF